jgi:hypothetical protein
MVVQPIDLMGRRRLACEVVGDVELSVDCLHEGPTARLGGVDQAHVRALMEVADRWPPILVQRSTLRIIDGVHRLYAARSLGWHRLRCAFFDGDASEAIIEGVRRNVEHGRPLTLRERKLAAERILTMRPFWSDRLIGETVGLSATTIGALRQKQCVSGGAPASEFRFGRDGKFRPHDRRELRRRIMQELEDHPTASLREIASTTGGSPETVRSVRKEMWTRQSRGYEATGADQGAAMVPTDPEDVLRCDTWGSDSALQSTDSSRSFAVWFSRTDVDDEWLRYVRDLPLSRTYDIADEARQRARKWMEIAEAVESRARQGQQVRA